MNYEFKIGDAVKVPNERIPEIIELLIMNGYHIDRSMSFNARANEALIYDPTGFVGTDLRDKDIKKIFPLNDFIALATGELPESWCVKCTEESMKHPEFKEGQPVWYQVGGSIYNIWFFGHFHSNQSVKSQEGLVTTYIQIKPATDENGKLIEP